MKPIEVLLLSRADVISLALTPADVVPTVEERGEHAAGTYEMHPKIGVHPTGTDPANFIHAMPAYLKQLGACGLKWVAGFAKNYRQDLPNVTGLQVYNDTATGIPLAIMDCSYLTGLARPPLARSWPSGAPRRTLGPWPWSAADSRGACTSAFSRRRFPVSGTSGCATSATRRWRHSRTEPASISMARSRSAPTIRRVLMGPMSFARARMATTTSFIPSGSSRALSESESRGAVPIPPTRCTRPISSSSTTSLWPSISTGLAATARPRMVSRIRSFPAACPRSTPRSAKSSPARSEVEIRTTKGSWRFRLEWPFATSPWRDLAYHSALKRGVGERFRLA